jgi:hypothetical protein
MILTREETQGRRTPRRSYEGGELNPSKMDSIIYQMCIMTMSVKGGVYVYEVNEVK